MVTSEDIDGELKKEPFQPFRVVTTTAKTYDITLKNRHLVRVGRRQVIIGSSLPESPAYFDSNDLVSLDQIVRLEPIPPMRIA